MKKEIETICVFGDSTAWGAWDLEKGGWVNRLWLRFAAKNEHKELYNLSISGGTTETILARFENEVKIRNADAIIFQTGGNDASFEGGIKAVIPPDKFEKNLREIIKRAKTITNNIIFVGLKNCNEERTRPVSWVDIHYTNANIQKYNAIMKNVCEKEKVLFLDIFGIMKESDFEDGLHPNAKGHEKIFQKVLVFLTQNNWI